MLDRVVRPSVSIVICAYTERRWDLLLDVIESVRAQTVAPQEILVVVDHNEDLYERLLAIVDDVTVVQSEGPPGLSGARNTGVGLAEGDIVAFLDDDAVAMPNWLERLLVLYDDPDVLAVGGRVEPVWDRGRPGYFGEELDWIVGCSHRGMPTVASEVRNLIGANMSFRLDVLRQVGGFNIALGRQGNLPLGCEETEICIRSTMGTPGSRIVYEPAALVRHHVPEERGLYATCSRGPGLRVSPKRRSATLWGTSGPWAPSGVMSAAPSRAPCSRESAIGAGATTPWDWGVRVRSWRCWPSRQLAICGAAGWPTPPPPS